MGYDKKFNAKIPNSKIRNGVVMKQRKDRSRPVPTNAIALSPLLPE